MSTLETHYTPGREPERYASWEAAGAFAPTPAAQTFAMILPPPNITGSLHMGHAYEHTISDAIIRHQRMLGRQTLWLPGTDHAGIATQALMERQLAAEGTTRQELGRSAFLDRIWDWRARTGETITAQMRQLGASPDWSRSLFTLDEGPSRATHEAFTTLFRQGLIYRAERPTSWCTRCQTTLADIETEDGPEGRTCARCRGRIEERTSPQWFLATASLARAARAALTSGQLRIEPAEMAETYLRWLDDMHDWCLSRQLWWGHRIPIWYSPDGQAHSFAPGEPIPDGWTQDEDSLDTWFSSGLWPLTTLGWPAPGADLERYYPNDLLITGYDLIFFWAIRMTMLCTHLSGTPPFRRLYLHGMIRDEHGKKMAKSFGNTIDPLEWTGEFGPDALRLALARRARPGADIPFGRSDILGAQALLKKLWSIARLASLHGITLADLQDDPAAPAHPLDRWLLSASERLRAATTDALERLDLAGATEALLRFTYDDLSDLYLEARKAAFGTDAGARATLGACLGQLLLLLHPIAPFLTEQLWCALGPELILDRHPWPAARPELLDPAAEADAQALRALLRAARSHRDAHGIAPGQPLPAAITGLGLEAELRALGRLTPQDPAGGTTLRHGAATLRLGAPPGPTPAALARQLARARGAETALAARLADPAFAGGAPAHVQAREAGRLAAARAEIARLESLRAAAG